jgi:outer membrane protein OmpA-like peptidoglycan-associated protein
MQTAAAAPAARAAGGPGTRVAFAPGARELADAGKSELRGVIDEMKKDQQLRLRLEGFATGGDETGAEARRVSLSRALVVRSYLMDQGIASTRMDVYARGLGQPDSPPGDRVDVTVVRR